MKRICFYLLLAGLLILQTKDIFAGSSVKVNKDWYYVNGERFLIKGIGYSNCKPHEQPNTKQIDLEQEKRELKIIREAGFNTIRTWKPMTIEELELARELGLYVIQGMWIEYGENYADPEKFDAIIKSITPVIKESANADNVLMYLVGNEPQPSQVFGVGRQKTHDFLNRLKLAINKVAPKTPVTMSNWVQCDFLDDSMWDLVALNIYIYNPESVGHAMGYRGYVDWLKRTRAPRRPLVITECGLSVSKTGVGHKGYGGNTEEEQKNGIIYMYKQALNGGVAGLCVFEFVDEWWKNFNHASDKDIHEDTDPEEWFGICYYDDKGEVLTKRLAYDALKDFNQAVSVMPVEYSKISKSTQVEVYVEESIEKVMVKAGNQEDWVSLNRKSLHWFEGKLSVKKLADGRETFYLKSINKDGKEVITEKVIYVDNKRKLKVPQKVDIVLDQDIYYTGSKMTTVRMCFQVKDGAGKAVPNENVSVAIYEPVLNQRLTLDLKTNENGEATHIYNINEEGILTVSAGVQAYPDDKSETDKKLIIKNGDCRHIQIFYEKKKE